MGRLQYLLLIFLCTSFNALALEPATLAEKLGLRLITQGNPLTFLGTHEIYANAGFNRQLLVVYGVPARIRQKVLIQHRSYLILQIPDQDQHVSIALIGISPLEIQPHLTSDIWRKIRNELNPITTAHAESCSLSSAPALADMEQLSRFYGTPGMDPLGCLLPLLQGAWAASGGMVTGGIESIQQLAQDPRGWWDGKVEQVEKLKAFVLDFNVRMQQLGATFMALPAEVKTKMLCMFAGSLAPGVLLSVISGGVGLATISAKLNAYLGTIMKLERVVALLQRLGKLSSIPASFFQRLSKGQVSDKLLDSMDLFARKNMDELITGAMTCAL
jgi:hypothetical protein